MTLDGTGEKVLRLAEGGREDTKEAGREPFVGSIEGHQRFRRARGLVRVEVRRIGVGRFGLRPEPGPVVVDGPQEERLAQIGRHLLPQGVGEGAGGESVIAPLPGRTRRMPSILAFPGQVEQGAGSLEGPFDDIRCDAVPGHGEEPDLLAGPGDASRNRFLCAPVEERSDVDSRDPDHRQAPWVAPAPESSASTAAA